MRIVQEIEIWQYYYYRPLATLIGNSCLINAKSSILEANGIIHCDRNSIATKIKSLSSLVSAIFHYQLSSYFRDKLILQSVSKVVSNCWAEQVVFTSFSYRYTDLFHYYTQRESSCLRSDTCQPSRYTTPFCYKTNRHWQLEDFGGRQEQESERNACLSLVIAPRPNALIQPSAVTQQSNPRSSFWWSSTSALKRLYLAMSADV